MLTVFRGLVLLLLVPLPLWAGTVVFTFTGAPVTLTTSAKQDDKLQRLLKEHNAMRAGAVPPQAPLTLEVFVENILVEELKRLSHAATTVESDDFCTVYQTWTQGQKDQVYTLGGNNSPCP